MPMITKDQDPEMKQYDGFDPKQIYQMIPVKGTRKGFKITTEAEAVTVTIEPTGIARFASPRSFDPPTDTPLEDFFMRLGPRTVAKFDLFGMASGQATLQVKNGRGVAVASLLISVKTPMAKTYSLCLVHDVRRRSPWLPPHDPTLPGPPPGSGTRLRPMMELVKKAFLWQTNLTLTEKTGTVYDVDVDRNLGDPIFLDGIVKPDNKVATEVIVNRSPSEPFGSDFVIYFVWDIKLRSKPFDIVGLNTGKCCYVEYNSASMQENFLTTAHEMGHGLGLGHNGRDVLMAGDGVSRSTLLEQFEIDTINQSGLVT